jgi:hypothetical protein
VKPRSRETVNVNVPARDLWISPHHAMFLDGLLTEARHLVNGVSIVQAVQVEEVEYFHIELDTHDVIMPKARCRKLSSTTTAAACSTTRRNSSCFIPTWSGARLAPQRPGKPRLPDSRAARNLRFCAADSSMTSTSRQKAGSVPAFTPILPGI